MKTSHSLHLLALISSLDDIIFELDENMRFLNTWSNPHSQKTMLYFSPETFLGKNIIEVFGPEHGVELAKKLKRVIETGEIENIEYTELVPGDKRWWNAKIAPIIDGTKDSPKNSNRLVCVISDITERKRTDRALRESEERYRCLVELAPDGIVVYQNSKAIFANATFLRQVKAKCLTDVLDRNVFDFIPPDRKPIIERKKTEALETKQIGLSEEVLQCLDGSTLPVEISGLPVTFQGEPAVQIVVRDISIRKKEAEEKAKLQARLHHSSKLASLGTLAAGVAHEINNPLAILMGNNEILHEALESTHQTKLLRYSQVIHDAGFRISKIAQGLNIYARTDGEADSTIDLHQVIKNTTSLVSSIFDKSEIHIELEFNCDSPRVAGNIGYYQQVIMNFLTNAKDAILETKRPGVIRVKTSDTEDGQIEITISDNGCGIEPRHMPHIFDPFYTTKPPGKGTGLGLSISHEIISSFGGALNIDSVFGQGTIVTFHLPRNNETAIKKTATKTKKTPPIPTGQKILIVDDEPGIRDTLRLFLESMGLIVDECPDGRQALRMLEKTTYAYVITDLTMPGLTGDILLEEAKKLSATSSTRFLIISGRVTSSLNEEQLSRLKSLADGWIQKPFTRASLQAVLHRAFTTLKK